MTELTPCVYENDFFLHICRARLSGRFAHIQNWGDRFAGITIIATIKANIGGPDEAQRNFQSWSTLLLKIYCRMADVNQEITISQNVLIWSSAGKNTQCI